jgi:pimeloyl-ACP methyl ester carboxylesterase
LSAPNGGEPLFFEGEGLRLAASAWGDPTGHPILFLHGHGQTRSLWSTAARLMASKGYYCISFDLRGHGDSGWASDGDYSMEGYARDIACVLDTMARPVTLCGASRGGYVALLAAAWRPAKVRMLMLCDVTPTARIEGRNLIQEFFELALRGFDSVEDVAQALATYLQFPVAEPERLRRALVERDGRLFFRWDPQTSAPQFFEVDTRELMEELATFKVPTALLRGQRESLISIDALREFKALVPHVVIEAVKGMRHIFTTADNPIVAARLLHHLRKGVGAVEAPAIQ